MNCFKMTNQYMIGFISLLTITFNLSAQTLKFKDLKEVKNTDSLAKKFQPNQPVKYLEQLLILENSWLKSENPKFCSKLEEIQALAVSQKKNEVLPILKLWNAQLLIKKRQHSDAFKLLTDALEEFQAVKDTVGILETYHSLSDLNLSETIDEMRNLASGAEYANKMVALAEVYGNKSLLVKALGQLMVAYGYNPKERWRVNGLIDRQLNIIGKNEELQKYKAAIGNVLARNYAEANNFPKAYETMKEYIPIHKKYYSLNKYYHYIDNFAYVCIILGKYDEAKMYLDEILNNTKSKEFWLVRVKAYNLYRGMYEDRGDYWNALVYADSSSNLQTKVFETENIERLNELEVNYKTKEVKSQNEALAKENELVKSRNRTIIIGVIVAAILIALLLAVLYFLNQSRKKAQLQAEEINKLSQIRDQYIRIIAHDLRSPIYAMQGMYDMVNSAIKTKHFEDLQKISNYIDETGIKTKHLLDNLLNWGLSQQEEVSYDPQKLNILENINEVISVYVSAKALKNFKITVNCDSDRFAYADKQGFQLILRNLVDNAIKNLPPNNGIINISVSADADKNVSITIQDNGKGITEEKLATINSVFNKPLSAVMGKNGLGLGITLIGKFVKRNKGFITAQSTINSGSRFTLSLPISS